MERGEGISTEEAAESVEGVAVGVAVVAFLGI